MWQKKKYTAEAATDVVVLLSIEAVSIQRGTMMLID
jgi:hypothetical protein